MFDATMGEDEGDQHMASVNPFGMDEEELVEVNVDGFEEIKIKDKKRPYRESVATENEVMAHHIDTELSQDSEDLDDWDLIDEIEVEVDKNGFRPPDLLNDPFKNKWRNTVSAYAEKSIYKDRRTYTLKPMIVKANDDCRQEVMAMQLIKRLQQIFKKANVKLYFRSYEILITSSNSGMIEFLPDTLSVAALKKKMIKEMTTPELANLRTFYEWYFRDKYQEAQLNFIRSLAAYSLFTYVFAIKDRHNGNIMIDRKGHLIHIDFGFML